MAMLNNQMVILSDASTGCHNVFFCLFLNVDPVCVEMDLVQPNKQTCDQVYHKTLR